MRARRRAGPAAGSRGTSPARASAAGRRTGWRPGSPGTGPGRGTSRARPACPSGPSSGALRSWRACGRRPRREVEVLGDGEPAEHARPAGELDDAEVGDLVGRRVRDVAAVEHHGTAIGFDDATDRLEQRALAGAVRAEQRHDLAFAQVEVDAADDRAAAVAGLEAAHQQQVGPTLPALVERLRAGRGGAPDLGDVGVDDPMDAAQHECTDDERRGPSPASRSGSSTRRRSIRRAAGSAGPG